FGYQSVSVTSVRSVHEHVPVRIVAPSSSSTGPRARSSAIAGDRSGCARVGWPAVGVVPLDNASWGFESNCFVCEHRNERGLRIPFEHDEGAALVRGRFRLGSAFSGAPQYIHGGVLLTVL